MSDPTIAKTLGDMERARGAKPQISDSMIEAAAQAIKTDFDHDHIVRKFANDQDWRSAAKAGLLAALTRPAGEETITLSREDYDLFVQALEAQRVPDPRLANLLRSKAPWERAARPAGDVEVGERNANLIKLIEETQREIVELPEGIYRSLPGHLLSLFGEIRAALASRSAQSSGKEP